MSDLDLSKIDIDSFKESTIIEALSSKVELVILAAVIILICTVVLFLKKPDIYTWLKNKSGVIAAIIFGWGIWCILVYSYSQLFEEYLDYFLWFILPPLCTFLIFIWYKTFIRNRQP
jgi:hypothetical protein